MMEGYMDVLTTSDIQSEDGFNQQMQLSMIRKDEYQIFHGFCSFKICSN